MKNKVMKVDEGDVMVWDIMTNVPNVNKAVSVISMILNVLIPGLGTGIAACADMDGNVSKVQLSVGLF